LVFFFAGGCLAGVFAPAAGFLTVAFFFAGM
jgi:hypothetical protein